MPSYETEYLGTRCYDTSVLQIPAERAHHIFRLQLDMPLQLHLLLLGC